MQGIRLNTMIPQHAANWDIIPGSEEANMEISHKISHKLWIQHFYYIKNQLLLFCLWATDKIQ